METILTKDDAALLVWLVRPTCVPLRSPDLPPVLRGPQSSGYLQ
jgi:hypothetical protein